MVAVKLDRRASRRRDDDDLPGVSVDIESDPVVPPAVEHHSSLFKIRRIPVVGAVVHHVVTQRLTAPEQQGVVGSRLLESFGLDILLRLRRHARN